MTDARHLAHLLRLGILLEGYRSWIARPAEKAPVAVATADDAVSESARRDYQAYWQALERQPDQTTDRRETCRVIIGSIRHPLRASESGTDPNPAPGHRDAGAGCPEICRGSFGLSDIEYSSKDRASVGIDHHAGDGPY